MQRTLEQSAFNTSSELGNSGEIHLHHLHHRPKGKLLACLLICLVTVMSNGCGSNGGSDRPGSPTQVVDLNLKDDTLEVGQGTVLSTDVLINADDVFGFGDNIVVVVKLPNGTSYREDTAELDGGRGSDIGLFPRVTQCLAGSSFIEFDLDPNLLLNGAPPSDDADIRLTLTVDADSPVGNVLIEARAARDRVSFSCNDSFSADQTTLLTVSPAS